MYKFNSVDPVTEFPDSSHGWQMVAKTTQGFDNGPSTEEEIDSTAACALNAGCEVQIVAFRKLWWNWFHYYLFVKEGE